MFARKQDRAEQSKNDFSSRQTKSDTGLNPSAETVSSGADREHEVRGATIQLASGGQPLPEFLRVSLERKLASDFSRVRVHDNAESDSLNRTFNSRAFAFGQDIFFKAGEYAPHDSAGQELLTHELSHVVEQQASGQQSVQRQPGDPARFKHVPPGAGAYTQAEYDDWEKHHPKASVDVRIVKTPKDEQYPPQWFWSRGYFYAGPRWGPYLVDYEVWLTNNGDGKEIFVYRDVASAKTMPPVKQPPTERPPTVEPPIEEPPIKEVLDDLGKAQREASRLILEAMASQYRTTRKYQEMDATDTATDQYDKLEQEFSDEAEKFEEAYNAAVDAVEHVHLLMDQGAQDTPNNTPYLDQKSWELGNWYSMWLMPKLP
jgi:Domain of unknown function (DUF4157)